jgi:hypothetical protein
MTKLEFVVSVVLLIIIGPLWFWSLDTLETCGSQYWALALLTFSICCSLLVGLLAYHVDLITKNHNVPF